MDNFCISSKPINEYWLIGSRQETFCVCKARSTLATMSKQRSTLSKGKDEISTQNSFDIVVVLATKSNVASTLLLVWTGFNTTDLWINSTKFIALDNILNSTVTVFSLIGL